jgi:quercetin dioxygenase-like cupin family protein
MSGLANDLITKAQSFNLAEEIEDLHASAAWEEGDRISKTLIKTADIQITLLTLKEGASLEEHYPDCRTLIHQLSGTIRVNAVGATRQLEPGDLLILDRAVAYEITAVEDAAFLVTLAIARP